MKIIDPGYEIIYPQTPNDWLKEAKFVELAARNCYKSENKISDTSHKAIIKNLVSNDHMAMLEFGSIIIRLICDRGVTHELVRHRLSSYAQESTRYCNYSKDKFGNEITVVKPVQMEKDSGSYTVWKSTCEEAEKCYFELLAQNVSQQVARSVLPTCLKTDIVMKTNFRELGHIFKLRISPKAHPDISYIFDKIYREVKQALPEAFRDI